MIPTTEENESFRHAQTKHVAETIESLAAKFKLSLFCVIVDETGKAFGGFESPSPQLLNASYQGLTFLKKQIRRYALE